MRMRRWVGLSVVIALSTLVATVVTPASGTAGAAGGPPVTLTVEYWSGFNPGGIDIVPAWINAAAAVLRRSHPNVKVVTDEITTGSEAKYYTKVDLGERSAATSADVVLEDSFLIGSDATRRVPSSLAAVEELAGLEQTTTRPCSPWHLPGEGLRGHEQHRRAAHLLQHEDP